MTFTNYSLSNNASSTNKAITRIEKSEPPKPGKDYIPGEAYRDD